jgi:ABC-2 type transport system ATP-binding protein
MPPAVLVEEVAIRYPSGILAVRDLSLSVSRGEIFGLLGLNGAGKSSLIKAMATLMRPFAGRIQIFGIDGSARPAEIKRRIGVVPQENNLDTYLDVSQNLIAHCRYAGNSAHVARSRTDHWLELLGLTTKAGESVRRLSGGTKRKVMLAKAFMTDPELLILDEPSAGLDPGVRDLLWHQILEFRNRGGTVFLSTHYLEEAECLCDRIGILHHGSLASILTMDARDSPRSRSESPLAKSFRGVVGEVH